MSLNLIRFSDRMVYIHDSYPASVFLRVFFLGVDGFCFVLDASCTGIGSSTAGLWLTVGVGIACCTTGEIKKRMHEYTVEYRSYFIDEGNHN